MLSDGSPLSKHNIWYIHGSLNQTNLLPLWNSKLEIAFAIKQSYKFVLQFLLKQDKNFLNIYIFLHNILL